MILFEDIKPSKHVKQSQGRSKEKKERKSEIRDLKQELKETKEDFQATVEELQTANEEWKSANEELQSANEELQSVNEELETSKEELDSLNEELVTVNSELQIKIDELTESSNDMKNLLGSTRIATIFLDKDLKVKRFTPESTKVINLIDSDIGRSIAHIVSKIINGSLVEDIESVLRTLVFVEKEVQTKDGHWYLMRILPYRTADDIIDGVVITFVNIDEQKAARLASEEARIYAESIVDTVREPLLVLNEELRIASTNKSFYQNFGVIPEETKDRLVYDLGNRQWDIPRLRELLEKIISENDYFNDFEVEHEFQYIGRRTMLLNARRVNLPGERKKLILLAIEDTTGRN